MPLPFHFIAVSGARNFDWHCGNPFPNPTLRQIIAIATLIFSPNSSIFMHRKIHQRIDDSNFYAHFETNKRVKRKIYIKIVMIKHI